jgi:hypothetical protein
MRFLNKLSENFKENLQEWKEHWEEFLAARHEHGLAWWLAVMALTPPFLVIVTEPFQWAWRTGLAEATRLALGRVL